MDLILWRHAEAVDAGEGVDDMDRPLTTRGERQAARMADWLERHLAAGTRILVSPARRCQQTARALDRRYLTVPEVAPGATAQALLEAARWPDSREPVLVIGHQPTLGQVSALLLAGTEQALSVKKGAVWWLRQRKRESKGEREEGIVLVAVRVPDIG